MSEQKVNNPVTTSQIPNDALSKSTIASCGGQVIYVAPDFDATMEITRQSDQKQHDLSTREGCMEAFLCQMNRANALPAERIAVQQERIAALEGMLAENKRVLRLAMGTVARLSAPVSDAEWLDLCAGDALQITDVQRHELDRFIAARTVPPAPQDTENAVSEAQ